MIFLHTEIGSARDNFKSPIHNWYKFTAGFSYKFVEEIIEVEGLNIKPNSRIFDPFAGCGTTLVSSQKKEVFAVGNEGQEFMFDIINAKLKWKLDRKKIIHYLDRLSYSLTNKDFNYNANPLLDTLYEEMDLKILYQIRNEILGIKEKRYKLFFKLALSQTLHKVSIHPIAVPYISRNKILKNIKSVWETFSEISLNMLSDTEGLNQDETAVVYKHDSRKINKRILDNSCNVCITSPPYLNNLDYGEVSKVHTHFFDITSSWNDITNKVRKKLVTGATTHYNQSDFNLEKFLKSEFYKENPEIVNQLITLSTTIKNIAKNRSGKKSFDLLTLFYFQDMYLVLKEIRRVLDNNGKAYLILGDSAPYGVYVPTTEILGRIAVNIGFSSYEIHKIRSRGTKWKSLKNRHSIELTENVLLLK
ncbi:methyltransferase [Flavobacterium lindanitolerans]|uniref:methyltransferase n=1 Tax=Flavobacterium lindanitolerans TaxID=428988 RepID=UPI0023526288|nr:methyltransferase [Flavobacterium lindanitolerans]